jgi:hypothetical protein
MRRLVPFWTFMSRNVPLQLQQMVLQPRAYQHYRSFVRNFSDPESDQSILPDWMRAAGGFRVTPGLALTPQVGLNNVSNDLEQLTNPTRMLSAANPLIKAPLSVMTNRNFFQDYDYGDRMERLEGINSVLGPALGLAGVSESLPGGGQAAPQAWVEAGRDLLPPLRLLARLTGAGERYEGAGKQQTAALSLLGLPLRRFNAEDAFNEAERRANERYYDQLAEAERREMLARL